VLPWGEHAERRPLAHAQSLYQLVLLAALSGTARAVVRDAVAFVRPRTRTFGVGGTSSPREDPLVQRVVGRLSSIASSVEAITLAAVRHVDAADRAGAADDGHGARWEEALVRVFEAQQVVLPLVLEAATSLFEVGGASAVDTELALDRHWRNARTIASHNPAILRERAVGDYRLNGVLPAAPGAPAGAPAPAPSPR
jgi:alkylation response protein AidB-like acyl-CoA dehydrogenase